MSAGSRINYIATPVDRLAGELCIPGDKSISHRAIIFASLAEGVSKMAGLLNSEDAKARLGVFSDMGVKIEHENEVVIIHGVGLDGLQASKEALYFGNSGTSVRLLSGILAAQKFDSTLTGDESLSRRPMRRIIAPLKQMGAEITCSDDGTLPMFIKGGKTLTAIDYEMPVASAQLKSCLLLAGLYADSETRITEPEVTRDHTERMLTQFGGRIKRHGMTLSICSGRLQARDLTVPGDISSAAFFIVAGSICPGADVTLTNVGINPTRAAVIDIIRMMGGDIEIVRANDTSTEPVADIRVRHSPLKGIAIPEHLVPIAIDEFPIIMIAAANAVGETTLSGAEELRVKESDRIAAIAAGLENLGIGVTTRPDGMTVQGGVIKGGEIDSYGDHRIAMAFSIAAINATAPITIHDCINVNTSYPGFVESANALGCNITIQSDHV